MGQSASTLRQRNQDLALFSSATQQEGDNSTTNSSPEQSDKVPSTRTTTTTSSKKNAKSLLFHIPVDTFVYMSQFLTVHQVVHQLTLVHPIIYDIMYHPHNVDSLWNNRNVHSLDDMFMFNLESQYIQGITSFIERVKVQRARIHLREWNEESTVNILRKLQDSVQEMHITAFEIRFKIAVNASKWAKMHFDKLLTFSCQNPDLRQQIISTSPNLKEYNEFRVHNDSTFQFKTLLAHKDISKYQTLAIRGNTNGTFQRESAVQMASFISEATNLTELDLCISVAPVQLLLNIFSLKNLKKFSLREGTFVNLPRTAIECNDPQLESIKLPEQFTQLSLTNLSDTTLVLFLIKKIAPQVQELTIQRCLVPMNHDLGPRISLPELIKFTSTRGLFRSQIRFLLSQSKKLQYLNLSEEGTTDPTMDLDTFASYLPKDLKEVIYKGSTTTDAANLLFSVNRNMQQLRIDHTAPEQLHFKSANGENLLRFSSKGLKDNFASLRNLRELRLEREISWDEYQQLTKNCDQLRKLRLHSLSTRSNSVQDIQTFFFLETFVLDISFTQLDWVSVLLLAISCGPHCTSFTTLAVNHGTNWNGRRKKPITLNDIQSIFEKESLLGFSNPSQKQNMLEWYESAFQNGVIPGAANSLSEFMLQNTK